MSPEVAGVMWFWCLSQLPSITNRVMRKHDGKTGMQSRKEVIDESLKKWVTFVTLIPERQWP